METDRLSQKTGIATTFHHFSRKSKGSLFEVDDLHHLVFSIRNKLL